MEDILKPVADQAANLTSIYKEGLVENYFHGHQAPHNYLNNTEFTLFNAWRMTSNVTWRDIGMKIFTYLLAKHGNVIPFQAKQLRPEDFTCQPCMLWVLRKHFVSWWIHERESTGYVDNRVKCWYGRECRTQAHNSEHAARLIHACDEVPAARRRNGVPPRGGGMALVPGDGVLGGGIIGAAVIISGVGNGGGGGADDGGGGDGVADDGGAGGGDGGGGGDGSSGGGGE